MAASWCATCTALGPPPTTAAYTPPTRRTVRTLHALNSSLQRHVCNVSTCYCSPLADDVRLLSLANGQYLRYFKHEARVCDLAVNYEIECFLSAAVDRSVRLWDYGMEKAAASSALPCSTTFTLYSLTTVQTPVLLEYELFPLSVDSCTTGALELTVRSARSGLRP